MPILKYGSKGAAVAALQRALSSNGHPVAADGDFGEKTEAALKAYQTEKGLFADGKYGPATEAALLGADTSRTLKETDIAAAAELLGVEPAAVKAVVQVESNGSGYLKDGRVKILFERHVFHRLLAAENKAAAAIAREAAPHVCNSIPGGYIGGTGEYPRLSRAMSIAHEIGMQSASWGLFQIMGCNYKQAGFDNIHAFVDAMKESEGRQLMAFAAFVKADKAMLAALQKHDWAGFARRYNGPAYKRNNYDSKLANAYARFAAKPAAKNPPEEGAA